MNTFRQSKAGSILEEIENLVLASLEGVESTKKQFLDNLTPYGYEAYKLAFQIIEYKYTSMEENCALDEDGSKQHFIMYHDFVISTLKLGGDAIFNFANLTFTLDELNNSIRQDTRSLEEIMDNVAKLYMTIKTELEAPCGCCHDDESSKASEEDASIEKLRNQLKDVAETLKELTKGKNGLKKFEIKMEKANFEITILD